MLFLSLDRFVFLVVSPGNFVGARVGIVAQLIVDFDDAVVVGADRDLELNPLTESAPSRRLGATRWSDSWGHASSSRRRRGLCIDRSPASGYSKGLRT